MPHGGAGGLAACGGRESPVKCRPLPLVALQYRAIMSAEPRQAMVFVDLETTGATASVDRITEIGIVEVTAQGEVREWSSLVNPLVPIPSFIQGLTGINDEMVASAPTFAQLADEVMQRLQGRLFVAHNARFDYGFLKQSFARLGMDFKASVLCTVKLSRKLYPQYSKHSLDALVERHGLHMPARHRALADAAVLWQFWQVLVAQVSVGPLQQAVDELTGRRHWPSQLDVAVLHDLPEGPGVYIFYGDADQALYVGKGRNVRQKVSGHFSADKPTARDAQLAQQVRRVEWRACAGELGAALQEAQLIRRWQPLHNLRKREGKAMSCTWRLVPHQRGDDEGVLAELVATADLNWREDPGAHGLFGSQRDAIKTLREIAESAQLCLVTLGLEKGVAGQACAALPAQQCSGVCTGQESLADHSKRLRHVMAHWRVQAWPFEGPVKVREGQAWHVLDAWCYLGTASDAADIPHLLDQARPAFDKDIYKLLVSSLQGLQAEALADPGATHAA